MGGGGEGREGECGDVGAWEYGEVGPWKFSMIWYVNIGRLDLTVCGLQALSTLEWNYLVLIWWVWSRVTLLVKGDIVGHVRLWDLLVRKERMAWKNWNLKSVLQNLRWANIRIANPNLNDFHLGFARSTCVPDKRVFRWRNLGKRIHVWMIGNKYKFNTTTSKAKLKYLEQILSVSAQGLVAWLEIQPACSGRGWCTPERSWWWMRLSCL